MNCSRCGNALSPSMKFCRGCGAAVEETDVGGGTPKSHPEPPADAGTPSTARQQPQKPAASRQPLPAPPAQPVSGSGRGSLFALAAIVSCLVIASLVGGGAYLLTKDKGSASDAPYGKAPWEEPIVEPWEPDNEDSGNSSTETTETVPSELEEARGTFRAHWRAIADGRYDDAYDLFHPGYDADRAGWISTHETEATLVNMYGIAVEPGSTEPRGDEYWLYVEVPLRDGGGAYAGDCRLFYGEVRLARSDGELLYRPGVYQGREGTFGRSELGGGVRDLPESSQRCP